MGRNIDNMTMAEIKDYVKKLEQIRKTQASMIGQYCDFMNSVEKFESEMRSWVTFYDTQRDFSLIEWLQNEDPEKEDELIKQHEKAIASVVASDSIAKLFDKFINFNAVENILKQTSI